MQMVVADVDCLADLIKDKLLQRSFRRTYYNINRGSGGDFE